jgi:hypothetical protein
MKHNAPPPLTQHLIEAFAASAWGWLMWLAAVIAKLGAPRRSRRLNTLVARLERAVENILFLRAVHGFGPIPRRARFPRGAPSGFRRQRHKRARLFFRNCGVRARKASIAQRIASLAAALADPEPHIAYFSKRLRRGLHGACLIPVAPPPAALLADAPRAAIIADSS